ncbi:MAG: hypothetical protein ACFFGZ_04890 [Candidatus Thorarchaeota archaeon]
MPKPDIIEKRKAFQREGRITEGLIPCPEPGCRGQLNYKREPRVYVCRVCGVEQSELQMRNAAAKFRQKKRWTERDLDRQFLDSFFGKPKKKGKWDDLIAYSERHSEE